MILNEESGSLDPLLFLPRNQIDSGSCCLSGAFYSPFAVAPDDAMRLYWASLFPAFEALYM